MSFDAVAARYERWATVQRSAADVLLGLVSPGPRDDVLDLGCGTGHLTERLRGLTAGRVTGADPSPEMIAAARRDHGAGVEFLVLPAEDLPFREAFDLVFCNSALQWFRDPPRALERVAAALRPRGRLALQAPARRDYCPQFLAAMDEVARDPVAGPFFAGFRNPWFFLETAEAYQDLARSAGLRVDLARLDPLRSRVEPEEAMRTFESGAAVGYLGPACYAGALPEGWAARVRVLVRAAFQRLAGPDGRLELVFHRVFLVATRP